MSESANVLVVKQLYETMSKGDLDGTLALMTEDITFVIPGPPSVGAGGIWRGHTGVRDCFWDASGLLGATIQEGAESRS